MQLRKESLKKFRIAGIRTLTFTIPRARDTWGGGGGAKKPTEEPRHLKLLMKLQSRIKLKAEYISSRSFENQPNEIYTHLSEKPSKSRFFKRDTLQNHTSEGKGKQKKKKRGGRKEEKRKKQWLHS